MPTCHISIYNDEINCINLVRKVEYLFYHNGSYGIKQVICRIILSNFTHKLSDEHVNFYQEFSVKFNWINRQITYSNQRSGNPGYLIGKPILVANLLINATIANKKNSNVTDDIIIRKNMTRNPNDFTDNFLTLPTSKEGLCMFNNVTYNIVEFKFDSIEKCKFQSTMKINKTKTANETCQSIQRIIFDYWLISTKNNTIKVVGDFGNADIKKLDDWSSILFYTNPDDILSNVTGDYARNNTTITCHNITTILKIDIFHSRVVYKNLNDQEKIIGTIYDFVGLKTLNFYIDNGIVVLDYLLRHEVIFFDIKLNKIKKYADPPTFEIKLPYDFFYPFVKLNNAADIPFYLPTIYPLLFYVLHLI